MCQKRAVAPLSGRNGGGGIRGRGRALGGLRFDDRRMSSHRPSSMSAVTQPGMECASRSALRVLRTIPNRFTQLLADLVAIALYGLLRVPSWAWEERRHAEKDP